MMLVFFRSLEHGGSDGGPRARSARAWLRIQARPSLVSSAAAAFESQAFPGPVWSRAWALKNRSTAGVSLTGVWYSTIRFRARMTRSTGLSPNGTEPCEVVPRATSFFHQVRFSPTSIPNQRTLPFSTLGRPSVQDVLDPFHQVGVTLQERPRAQSADLLVGIADTRSRFKRTPARLSATKP